MRVARALPLLWLLCLLGGLAGCAGQQGPAVEPNADPWERMNRGTWKFNEGVDRHVFEPVAKGYDYVVPVVAQRHLRDFFANLNAPVTIINNLLQGKPAAAGQDVARLLMNTVFGLGGFIDLASRDGVPESDEGFGQTLGVWGVPEGPYLVLPFLGPSTPRETVGFAADAVSRVYPFFIPFYVNISSTGVNIINTRAWFIEEIDQSREDAFDYYIFARNAYLQNLRKRVRDAAPEDDDYGLSEEEEDDLYFFDDDEDADLEEVPDARD